MEPFRAACLPKRLCFCSICYKVKVVPYTFIRRGVPFRENTYPEPSACEVGWPVPLSLQCCHRVPICCWMNSEQAFSQGIESDSKRRPFSREACALTTMSPRPIFAIPFVYFSYFSLQRNRRFEGHISAVRAGLGHFNKPCGEKLGRSLG